MEKLSISAELAPQIFSVIEQIPYGCVASYGQVARLAGLPKHARLVGYLLKRLHPQSDLAWHRVVNAQGQIQVMQLDAQGQNIQQLKLCAEGIIVYHGRVNLNKFAWQV